MRLTCEPTDFVRPINLFKNQNANRISMPVVLIWHRRPTRNPASREHKRLHGRVQTSRVPTCAPSMPHGHRRSVRGMNGTQGDDWWHRWWLWANGKPRGPTSLAGVARNGGANTTTVNKREIESGEMPICPSLPLCYLECKNYWKCFNTTFIPPPPSP